LGAAVAVRHLSRTGVSRECEGGGEGEAVGQHGGAVGG